MTNACPECGEEEKFFKVQTGFACGDCGKTYTAKQYEAAIKKVERGTVHEFVKERLKAASYDYRHDAIRLDGELIRPGALVLQLYSASEEKGFEKARLEAEVELWMDEREKELLDGYRGLWAGSPDLERIAEARRELRRWVRAVSGTGANGLSYVVMLHWFWQVKRKLVGLSVENHVCPVLVGRTQGGKSVAVQKLTGPVRDITADTSLAALSDERHWFAFERDYIGVLEELAGAAKKDMEQVKYVLTSPTLNYRELGKNYRHTVTQNCTFIGTSNIDVVDVIQDPTSARRFWEIRCQDRLDWKEINSIDYSLMWQCVDPQQPSPLKGRWLRLVNRAQHKHLRAKPWTEQFLENYDWDPNGEGMKSEELWDELKVWAEDNLTYKLGKARALTLVGKAAKRLWGPSFETQRRRENEGRSYVWPLRKV